MIKQPKRVIIKSILFMLIFGCFLFPVFAESKTPDCTVSLIKFDNVDLLHSKINALLSVNFSSNELYNENVFISYHVYDMKQNEILFEGERLPIPPPKNKTSIINFTSDLKKYPELKKYEKYEIKFDVVDQKNLYWFSLNPNLVFKTDSISFNSDFAKKIVITFTSSIKKSPIIFSINLCFLILSIVLYFYIKKRLTN
nr:hypothetical protein [uncultured Aminipila sp.]